MNIDSLSRTGELLEALNAQREAGTAEDQIVIMELPPVEIRAIGAALFITSLARLHKAASPREVYEQTSILKDEFLRLIELYDPVMLRSKILPRVLDNLMRDIKDLKGTPE